MNEVHSAKPTASTLAPHLLRIAEQGFAAFAERGETEVRLKVRADNLAARRAYEKAGFTPAAFV